MSERRAEDSVGVGHLPRGKSENRTTKNGCHEANARVNQ